MLFKDIYFISYYVFYSLHVVEPLRNDSVLIKETNEWMSAPPPIETVRTAYVAGDGFAPDWAWTDWARRRFVQGQSGAKPSPLHIYKNKPRNEVH